MTTEIRQFGEYHWRLLNIVEEQVVDHRQMVYIDPLRAQDRYNVVGSPTYWVCLRDLEAAGLLKSLPPSTIHILSASTDGNLQIVLTDRGWRIAGQLRRWIADGNLLGNFKPDEPPVAGDAENHQGLHDAVHRADEWIDSIYWQLGDQAMKTSDEMRRMLYGDWSPPEPGFPRMDAHWVAYAVDRADAILRANKEQLRVAMDAAQKAHDDEMARQAFNAKVRLEYDIYSYNWWARMHGKPISFDQWLIGQLRDSQGALSDLFELCIHYDCESDIEEAAKEADRHKLAQNRTQPLPLISEWARVLGIFAAARTIQHWFRT